MWMECMGSKVGPSESQFSSSLWSTQSVSLSHCQVLKIQWPLEHLNCQSWQVLIWSQSSSSDPSGQSVSPSHFHACGRHAPPTLHCSCDESHFVCELVQFSSSFPSWVLVFMSTWQHCLPSIKFLWLIYSIRWFKFTKYITIISHITCDTYVVLRIQGKGRNFATLSSSQGN